MNTLQGIIDLLADQADDLLVDAANRKEARAALGDTLAARYPKLSGVDRQKVTDSVMAILEQEEFFATNASNDSSEEETEETEEV